MQALATNILSHVQDYRNEDGIQLTIEQITTWAMQFGADALFMLTELNYIIPKTYLSKQKAKDYLSQHLQQLAKDYHCNNSSFFYTNKYQFIQ